MIFVAPIGPSVKFQPRIYNNKVIHLWIDVSTGNIYTYNTLSQNQSWYCWFGDISLWYDGGAIYNTKASELTKIMGE